MAKTNIKTPVEFMQKVDDYFANPTIVKHHFKNDVYEVPHITSEAIAMHLGYHPKYIYALPEGRKEEERQEWQDAIDYMRFRIISYYKLVAEHGNPTFGIYMLGCHGIKPEQKEEKADDSIEINIIDAVKNED